MAPAIDDAARPSLSRSTTKTNASFAPSPPFYSTFRSQDGHKDFNNGNARQRAVCNNMQQLVIRLIAYIYCSTIFVTIICSRRI